MIFDVTNTISFVECLALAWVLAVWADRVAGARLLVLFLGGVSVWLVGNELPHWLGAWAARWGLDCLCTAPLGSALFFDFSVRFSEVRVGKRVRWGVYGVGLVVSVAALIVGPGGFESVAGLGLVVFPNAMGWVATLTWAGLAAAGHGVLAQGWRRAVGVKKQQIGAIGVSSLCGLFCMSGYGVTALGLPMAPWPLLALPGYPLMLVYGILRYRVFIANVWAQRALVWGLLTVLAVVAIGFVAVLPLGGEGVARFVSGGLVAVVCLGFAGPLKGLAERLVYPGGTVSGDDLVHWREALRGAEDGGDLARRAEAVMARRLGLRVGVAVGDGEVAAGQAGLVCRREATGWRTELSGWEAAPVGPQRVAEVFGLVLADEAERLERAVELAARERERGEEKRLAELGALAATVAHDVRNPLNVISMAAGAVAGEMRGEILGQVARISRLTGDLLDYAKPWGLARERLDVVVWLAGVAGRYAGVELGAGVQGMVEVVADPHRLEQAVVNLLDNAVVASCRVGVDVERGDGAVMVHVFDGGAGIAAEIRERIFQPFVSRNPGGTGLGLAVVARVMEAHGGRVAVTQRAGWTTCFTLWLPAR